MPFCEIKEKRNHQANCVMGGTAPGSGAQEERFATILLCNMLGGPASNSILDSILREKKGWVYNVECAYTPYTEKGVAVISFGCDRDNLDACERLVRRELKKLQEKPISQARLRAAKRQLLGQNAIGMESGEAQCLSMGKSLLNHGVIMSDEEVVARVEAVTAEMVQRMACEVFGDDNLNKMVYL